MTLKQLRDCFVQEVVTSLNKDTPDRRAIFIDMAIQIERSLQKSKPSAICFLPIFEITGKHVSLENSAPQLTFAMH